MRQRIGKHPEILMHPQLPKPLHGMSPRVVLGKEWWDTTRRKCYDDAGYRCEACGVGKKDAFLYEHLEAHEQYHIDSARWRMVYVRAVALCHLCHTFIHMGRLRMMIEKRQRSLILLPIVISHGARVLKGAGLYTQWMKNQMYGDVDLASNWNKWRLVVFGREYEGKFKSIHEWYHHYNP